jgi:hypothetical protein
VTNDLRATILTLGDNISKPNEREGAPSPSNKGEGGRDRSASVTQAVVAALQGMIRDGTFKSGAALPPQRELAKQLGVSRASLREAVSILGTLGQLSIEQALFWSASSTARDRARRSAHGGLRRAILPRRSTNSGSLPRVKRCNSPP